MSTKHIRILNHPLKFSLFHLQLNTTELVYALSLTITCGTTSILQYVQFPPLGFHLCSPGFFLRPRKLQLNHLIKRKLPWPLFHPDLAWMNSLTLFSYLDSKIPCINSSGQTAHLSNCFVLLIIQELVPLPSSHLSLREKHWLSLNFVLMASSWIMGPAIWKELILKLWSIFISVWNRLEVLQKFMVDTFPSVWLDRPPQGWLSVNLLWWYQKIV